MNYKIISDSSSDLLALAGIAYSSVPLKIITDEKEYVDDAALDLDGMIADLQKYKGKSKSSCPNVEEWKNAFEDYDGLFCVTITSGLSGSYNAASLAMSEYLSDFPEKKGLVIDSLSAGAENALIVEKLQQLISSGLTFEQIEQEITEYKRTTHLTFSLDSLRNLANNGRVSFAVAKLAGLLGIRIIGKASLKGTLEVTGKARGAEKALADVYKDMLKNGYNGGKVRIHQCQNEKAAGSLEAMIKKDFPDASVTVQGTRALCSFYAEAGGLLVGYEGAEKARE